MQKVTHKCSQVCGDFDEIPLLWSLNRKTLGLLSRTNTSFTFDVSLFMLCSTILVYYTILKRTLHHQSFGCVLHVHLTVEHMFSSGNRDPTNFISPHPPRTGYEANWKVVLNSSNKLLSR